MYRMLNHEMITLFFCLMIHNTSTLDEYYMIEWLRHNFLLPFPPAYAYKSKKYIIILLLYKKDKIYVNILYVLSL